MEGQAVQVAWQSAGECPVACVCPGTRLGSSAGPRALCLPPASHGASQGRYCGTPPLPSTATFGTSILKGGPGRSVLAQFVSSLQLFCQVCCRWLQMPNGEGCVPLNHPSLAETSTPRQLPPPTAQGRTSARKRAERHTAHSALLWLFLN